MNGMLSLLSNVFDVISQHVSKSHGSLTESRVGGHNHVLTSSRDIAYQAKKRWQLTSL